MLCYDITHLSKLYDLLSTVYDQVYDLHVMYMYMYMVEVYQQARYVVYRIANFAWRVQRVRWWVKTARV